MESLRVKGLAKFWENNKREKIGQEVQDVGKRNRIGGVRVERVNLFEPGFNKILEKVRELICDLCRPGFIILIFTLAMLVSSYSQWINKRSG